MFDGDDFWALRACLLAPLPEHEVAAGLLSDAVDAVLADDFVAARDLVRRADMPLLYGHAALVMNGGDRSIQRRRPVAPIARLPTKVAARMPSAEATRTLFARDGWRCRFCGCRVVPPKARSALRAALPGAIPWSETEGFHGAFFAMSASVDHVVPYSAGGTNAEENVVTACWSCQFGRGAWSLEEVGLLDPRSRAPVLDDWDGLTRLLNSRMTAAPAEAVAAVTPLVLERRAEIPDAPPPEPRRSWLGDADWFAALDAIQPTPSSRLIAILDAYADLGVTWS